LVAPRLYATRLYLISGIEAYGMPKQASSLNHAFCKTRSNAKHNGERERYRLRGAASIALAASRYIGGAWRRCAFRRTSYGVTSATWRA